MIPPFYPLVRTPMTTVRWQSVTTRKQFAAFLHAYDALSDARKMIIKAEMREMLEEARQREQKPRQVEKSIKPLRKPRNARVR